MKTGVLPKIIVSLGERCYSKLLSAYPRSFRDRYGAFMKRALQADLRTAARKAGTAGVAGRFLAVAAKDLWTAAEMRLEALRRSKSGPRRIPHRKENPMTGCIQDIGHAVRVLWRRPLWSAATAGILALGIGASTAVFSLVNDVLLRPLPYPAADRLMVARDFSPENLRQRSVVSFPSYEIYRQNQNALEQLEVFAWMSQGVRLGENAESVSGALVSSSLFATLRVRPFLGRGFSPAEDEVSSDPVVILSYSFWQDRFGADPAALGRVVELDEVGHTVVGIMPPTFEFPSPGTRFWVPLREASRRESTFYLRMLGRLKDGIGLHQARSRLEALRFEVPTGAPNERQETGLAIQPLHEAAVGDFRSQLLIFQAAVLGLLLIACVNAVSLLLARTAGRSREMALRSALGAGRLRLLNSLLTEGLALAALGCAGGAVISVLIVKGLMAVRPGDLPRSQEIGIDPTALLFSAGLSLLVGLFVGSVPAWGAGWSKNLVRNLREGAARLSRSPRQRRLQSGLIVAQVAAALVLAVSGFLLSRTFVRILDDQAGFEPEKVLTFEAELPDSRYPDFASKAAFYGRLLPAVEALPGVSSAALASQTPFRVNFNDLLGVEGYSPGPKERPIVNIYFVGPSYFKTIGNSLAAGRLLGPADGLSSVVINQTFADRYYPQGDAVGGQIQLITQGGGPRTVVGVVADVRHHALGTDPQPVAYVPYGGGEYVRLMRILVKADSDLAALAGPVRSLVASLDPQVPVAGMQALSDFLWGSVAAPRFRALLMNAFALTALLLASVGLYGITAQSVNQRRREMGIRMALGSSGGRVAALFLSQGLRLTALGVAIGLFVTYWTSGLLESFLFDLPPLDPASLFWACLTLTAAALLACAAPARRASRLDPSLTLRSE